jgi:hypothetical protein
VQYLLTVVVSNPQLFVIPAAISFAAVAIASITYSCFVFKEHGHLFHKNKLKELPNKTGKKFSTLFLDFIHKNKKQKETAQIELENITAEEQREELETNIETSQQQYEIREQIEIPLPVN